MSFSGNTHNDILVVPTTLCSRHHPPRANQVIRVPRKQRLAIRTPRQTHTLGLPALLPHGRILGLQLVDLALLLQIEDDDRTAGRGAQPVAVGGEDQRVDLVAGGEGVEVLGFVEVPQHGRAVFAAGGAQRAIGGDGHGVDVAGVADVVGLDAAGGEFPDLEDGCFSSQFDVDWRALDVWSGVRMRDMWGNGHQCIR